MSEERGSRPDTAAPRVRGRRGWPRTSGLGTRLFAIFLVAALPALAIAYWTSRVERERRIEEVRNQTVRLAGRVASEHRRIMDAGRGVLVAVSHLPQVIDSSAGTCQTVLVRILQYYRALLNIGVTDLAGNVMCSAVPAPPGTNLADREYFQQAVRRREFTVSNYQISRITNRPSISFAYPVEDPSGEVTGVAIAAFDLDALAAVAEGFLTQLPDGSRFTMLDRDGVVIAQKPGGRHSLGVPLEDAALRAEVLAGEPGNRREDAAGGAIVHAFSPVRNPLREIEWYAVLSLPENALFAALDRGFRQSLLMLALVLVIAAATGRLLAERLVLRPTARILEATRNMEAGNLGARVGPDHCAGEIGDLGRAFDRMATALEQREGQLEENQERLLALSRRLLAAQEDERRRIARELHDELGQLLTGAKINLVSMQGGSARPHPGFDPLADSIDLVARALTTVREISTELRPSLLDDAGLEEALHWLLARTSNRSGFTGRLEAEPLGADVPPEVETAIFRIAQEALTNVARHARAENVALTLRRRGADVELTIEDDGVGFDTQDALRRSLAGGSLGLTGMQERIKLAGGSFEIDSSPGTGTRLRASVPLVPAGFDDDWRTQRAC